MAARCCHSRERFYRLEAAGRSITAGGYPVCHNTQSIISSHTRKNVVLNSHGKNNSREDTIAKIIKLPVTNA